jgi:hypothetical protein
VSSAIQKYNASNTTTRVRKDLEDVYEHYNTVSKNEKVDMVLKVIIQNRMGELNIYVSILFTNKFIPDIQQLNKDDSLADI